MKTVAITGPPSVDLSILVRWLNGIDGVAVTQEGRTFSLLYDLIQRSMTNPWLLDQNMTGVLRESLVEGLPRILEDAYGTISGPKVLKLWGDAHAHYIDPLDKPGFLEFYFGLFPAGSIMVLLEDPMASIEKLINHQWVTTTWDAADVVARHFAASEQALRKHKNAVFSFNVGATSLNRDDNPAEALEFLAWLGLPSASGIEDLVGALAAAREDRQWALGSDALAAYEERLQHWRTELAG